MAAIVSLQDVVDSINMMGDESHAYLNKETGELVTIFDEEIQAMEDGESWDKFPEWQKDSLATTKKVLHDPHYLSLPSKFDIEEYHIMERFCYSVEDSKLSDELLYQIQGHGAFRRFKDAIHRYGIQDKWYQFRDEALEEIAVEWLESNEIPYSRNNAPKS